MIKNIILYAGYALVSSFGLYKIKLSSMVFGMDLILGALCYGVGFLVWLIILKTNPLSTAFPLAASALIIATQFFGFFLLGESFNGSKVVGIIFIVIGIVMIFKMSN